MSNDSGILSPHEPMVDKQGKVTRSWWRVLNEKFSQSGTTAAPLVVNNSVVLNGGDFSSGGTITTPDIPAYTLLGNPENESTQPSTIAVAPSLTFNHGGSLEVTPIAAGTLFGNSGSVSAPPSAILIGSGLTLDPQLGLAVQQNTSANPLDYLTPDRSGQVFDARRKADDALTAALLRPSPVTSNTMLLTGSIINAGMVTLTGTDVAISGNGSTITFNVAATLASKTLTSPVINTPTIHGMTEPLFSNYVPGTLSASLVVLEQIVPYPFTIPTTLSSHFMLAGTTATGAANFALNVVSQTNSVTTVGTLQVAAGTRILNTGAGTITASGTYSAGTAVQMVAPGTVDATLAGFSAVLGIQRQT